MTTWKMNGETMDSRENDINKLREFVKKGEFTIEDDRPDYLAFYDRYGNKHEYIKDN